MVRGAPGNRETGSVLLTRRLIAVPLLLVFVLSSFPEDGESFLDQFSLTVGQLNDNVPISYERATDGWSIGPDDQYTFSLLSHISYERFLLRSDFVAVTSRLLEYRFDYLDISLGYTHPFGFGSGDISLGMAGRGNFGAEAIQNFWHEAVIGYPPLVLPYLETKLGVHVGAGMTYDLLRLQDDLVVLRGFGDIDLYIASGPNKAAAGVNAFIKTSFLDVEAIIGFEYHFLLEPALDDLVKDGLFAAVICNIRPVRHFSSTLGFGLFPVQNVTDDPAFKAKEYPVIPQFWYLFTVGAASPKARNSPLP